LLDHSLELQVNCDKLQRPPLACRDYQISDVAWGQFLNLLEYKGDWYGCDISRIDRFFPSSKRCSRCGYIKEDLTLKDREWNCPECQAHHDRDINACHNLLAFSESKILSEGQESTPKNTVEMQCIKLVTT
jgi:putative transposase